MLAPAMLFSKFSDGLKAAALTAAGPAAAAIASAAKDADDKQEEKKQDEARSASPGSAKQRHHRSALGRDTSPTPLSRHPPPSHTLSHPIHRRRRSHHRSSSRSRGEESKALEGTFDGTPSYAEHLEAPDWVALNPGEKRMSPVPGANETVLERATHALESMGDAARMGRQVYHEQLTNTQLALTNARAKLEHANRDKLEAVAHERGLRDRAEKDAAREAKRSDHLREASEGEIAQLRAKIAELNKELEASQLEASRKEAAHSRESAVQHDTIDESTRNVAKYRSSVSSLEAQLEEAIAAQDKMNKSHQMSLTEARRKIGSGADANAAAKLQNAAIRMSLARALDDRARLGAAVQEANERSQLLRTQLDVAESSGQSAARRDADLNAQIERMKREAELAVAEREAERKRAADELAAKEDALNRERQLGVKLCDQLREARAEAVHALQMGAEGERQRTRGEIKDASEALREEQEHTTKLREQLREARADAVKALESGAQAEREHAKSLLATRDDELKRERQVSTDLAEQVKEARQEALAAAQAAMNNKSDVELLGSLRTELIDVRAQLEASQAHAVELARNRHGDAEGYAAERDAARTRVEGLTAELHTALDRAAVAAADRDAANARARDAEALITVSREALEPARKSSETLLSKLAAAEARLEESQVQRKVDVAAAEAAVVEAAAKGAAGAQAIGETVKRLEAQLEEAHDARRQAESGRQAAQVAKEAMSAQIEQAMAAAEKAESILAAERAATQGERAAQAAERAAHAAERQAQADRAGRAAEAEREANVERNTWAEQAQQAEQAAQAAQQTSHDARLRDEVHHAQELVRREREGSEELVRQLTAARAEAVRLLEERNAREQSCLDARSERDAAYAQTRSMEEEVAEARRERENALDAEKSRAKSYWENELDRRMADQRAEAARELKRIEGAAQANLLEQRRKAAAELAQVSGHVREARGEGEATASSLRAEVATIRASAEEAAATSAATVNALRLEVDDARRRLETMTRPGIKEKHAQAVGALASARERRATMQATLDAINEAVAQLHLPSLQDTPASPPAAAPASGDATGADPAQRALASTEQLVALYAEQRGALRVAHTNESSLREEGARLRRQVESLQSDLATKMAAEAVRAAELDKLQTRHTAAEMRAVELAADLDAARHVAAEENARRSEARNGELAVIEAELSAQLKGASLEHAADAASLRAELQAARAAMQVERLRREEELSALRSEFEGERRELAKVHRKALQSAADLEKRSRARKAAIQQATGGGDNVVTRIFTALVGPGEGGQGQPAPRHPSPGKSPGKRGPSKRLPPGGKAPSGARRPRPPSFTSSDGLWRTPNNLNTLAVSHDLASASGEQLNQHLFSLAEGHAGSPEPSLPSGRISVDEDSDAEYASALQRLRAAS